MKKLLFAILTITVLTFAKEKCNTGDYEVQTPPGSCTNEGYVFLASTDERGGILFRLGKSSSCKSFETTDFVTYPVKNERELDTLNSINQTLLYMMEDPLENVGALAVATNTAFIINALNEKFKVCVNYHRAVAAQTKNQYNMFSVRLQSITKCD